MKYKALDNIYWFKKGQIIGDEDILAFKRKMSSLINKGKFEPVPDNYTEVPVEPEKKLSAKNKKRLEDIRTDLLDDGKLNYSHDPDRKKPGRKKSVRTKK